MVTAYLSEAGVWFGRPQCGQAGAASEIWAAQSGQVMSGIGYLGLRNTATFKVNTVPRSPQQAVKTIGKNR